MAAHTSLGQKLTLLFVFVCLIFAAIFFGMLLVPIPTDCSDMPSYKEPVWLSGVHANALEYPISHSTNAEDITLPRGILGEVNRLSGFKSRGDGNQPRAWTAIFTLNTAK
jgi:hypothetical protein